MKIKVECRATVEIEVKVTAAQLRQLEAGELQLDELVDVSVPYRALSGDGEFEFVAWEALQPKRRRAS